MTPRNRRMQRAPRAGGAKPPAIRAPLPATVLVRSGLLRAIAGATGAAGDCETGGPLVGTVQRSWEGPRGKLLVSVLATVPPGPRTRGAPASVALGRGADGERAASALRWWRSVTGLDLLHVGDWHRHPSGSFHPSAGDRKAAERMHARTSAPVWLTAIAVGERLAGMEEDAEGSVARAARSFDESCRVRFHRQAEATGLVPVTIRLEDDAIPCLPALPWHITDPARFVAEARLLNAAGFSLGIEGGKPGRHPGLSLRIAGDGSPPLTVATGPRYPHEPPLVLDGPKRWAPPDGGWSADRFLIDLVGKVA